MIINIRYDIHAYSKEQLCDEIFERGDGIVGKEIIQKLNAKRNKVFQFEYSENTLMRDVVEVIRQDLDLSEELLSVVPVYFGFMNNGTRYYIDDYDAGFAFLLEKYLLDHDSNTVTAHILMSCNAGVVDEDGELRYKMKSKEWGKHFEPHVHVVDTGHNFEASISLLSGEILEGNMPKKLANMAKKRIMSKRVKFLEWWNTKTDGLKVDINKELGLIKY